jgi:hypothetical protein
MGSHETHKPINGGRPWILLADMNPNVSYCPSMMAAAVMTVMMSGMDPDTHAYMDLLCACSRRTRRSKPPDSER